MNLHNHQFTFGLCFLSKSKCILCFDKIEKKKKSMCIWGKKQAPLSTGKAQALSSRNKASLWKQVNLVFAQHFLGAVRHSSLYPQVLPANPLRIQPAPWCMWQTGFMSPARWINDFSKKLACSRDLIFFFYVTVLTKALLGHRGSWVSQENQLTNSQSLSSREGKALLLVSRQPKGEGSGLAQASVSILGRETQPGQPCPPRSAGLRQQTNSMVKPGGICPAAGPWKAACSIADIHRMPYFSRLILLLFCLMVLVESRKPKKRRWTGQLETSKPR